MCALREKQSRAEETQTLFETEIVPISIQSVNGY